MKMHLQDNTGSAFLIHGHTAETITVGDNRYTSSLALGPGRLVEDWTESAGNDLARDDIAILVEMAPELILIGTGKLQHFPDPAVLRLMIDKRIGYEIMTTAAACRTYNVLVGEGRLVAAGLILPA